MVAALRKAGTTACHRLCDNVCLPATPCGIIICGSGTGGAVVEVEHLGDGGDTSGRLDLQLEVANGRGASRAVVGRVEAGAELVHVEGGDVRRLDPHRVRGPVEALDG